VAQKKPDDIVVKVKVGDSGFKSILGRSYGFSLSSSPSLSFNQYKVIQLYTSHPRRGVHIPEGQVARVTMSF
jgi:hypothetical protein